ncbi:hypothetical protein EDC96DRAFT_580700 [Choanephora cucurbitarum]|nr:hypothetical protein EDC96DRAFT_580700 [Choanephora cucurbitarum]
MDRVLFEDGRGNIYDENNEQVHVFEMEVDEDEYPLEDVTNFDKYLDSKPLEKSTIAKPSTSTEPAVPESEGKTNRVYRFHKSDVKNHFFFLLSEKNMSIRAAAKELQIPQSTEQTGRPFMLTEDHVRFIIDFLDENPLSILDDMMEGLTSQFADLQIKKSSLHDFVT